MSKVTLTPSSETEEPSLILVGFSMTNNEQGRHRMGPHQRDHIVDGVTQLIQLKKSTVDRWCLPL